VRSWSNTIPERRQPSQKAGRKQGAQDDAISLQKEIFDKSVNGYWNALYRWPTVSQYVFGPDLRLLGKAASIQTIGKVTVRDWKKLKEMSQLCEDERFRHIG